MCSNQASPDAAPSLADIERAIDELAALALAEYSRAGTRQAGAAGTAGTAGDERVLTRLAELWSLLADLDPEVARRLPAYQASRLATTDT